MIGAGSAHAQHWEPIDFSQHYNFGWQSIGGGMASAPSGQTSLGDVPFTLGLASQNNAWFADVPPGTDPRHIDISTDLRGVIEVNFLINTFWGQRESSYLAIEFFGSQGAYYRKDLIGNTDIRDFNQDRWTNFINGTTTIEVWRSPMPGQRLDKQRIELPQSFATATLERIRLTDTGQTNFQRAVLYGVTARTFCDGQACMADLNCDGLVDFMDFLVYLNLYIAQEPAADFTGDGLIDFADYLEFLNQFEAGC